jgi:hypothetical protein
MTTDFVAFAQPAWLALALVLPVLWWLSLPPRPRHVHWTPHLAQWQNAIAALRRRAPRASSLRFLLLALAAAAAAVAAAGPFVPAQPGPGRLVVLLDGSASMAAGRDGSAFARARESIAASMAVVPPHVDVTVVRIGGDVVRRHGASARALHDLGAPAGPLAVDLAAAARRAAAEDTVVWTVTDGHGQQALPDVGALTVLPRTGPNAAVLAVRWQDAWPLPGLAAEVDVLACAGAGERPLAVTLRAEGALEAPVDERVAVTNGVVATTTLALARAAAGGEVRIRVALDGDVLAADDTLRAWLPPLPVPRIAVLAEADAGPFARVAAEALAAEVGGAVVADPTPGSGAGWLLVDGGVAAIQPGRARGLLFGCRPDAGAEPEPWLSPTVADWDRESALTRGLDLSELRIDRAWRRSLPPGQVFLWADEVLPDAGGERTPLAVVSGDETATVHFAFRLADSNLPLLPAFPQLLRRAFVRSHGVGAIIQARDTPPPPAEVDLREVAPPVPDRPLPPFGGRDEPLARWCVLAGLVFLLLRAGCR